MNPSATSPLRIAWIYDLDAARTPTGVTRHALAQHAELAKRSGVQQLTITGRLRTQEGHAAWNTCASPRHQLPLPTRDMLRLWRVLNTPSLETWTGPVDWVYSPAEYFVSTRRARLAVTSHDMLQDRTLGGPRRLALLSRLFPRADLILSVSDFNTHQIRTAFPNLQTPIALVPNAPDDFFFEPSTPDERAAIRVDLGLPPNLPYLLSVANFQPRKNLERLIHVAGKLPEIAQGDLALVLLGTGSDDERRRLDAAIADLPKHARVLRPGYRQGPTLRAAYADALALVFPSTCESFGIPAVEAMSQGCPVALADSTALPEIAAGAGWYFDPNSDDALQTTLRQLLDRPTERAHRIALGRERAAAYHWSFSGDRLIDALQR